MNKSINISDLSVNLGGREILHKISIHFSEGEFVSVLGRNGAGKSTLLRSIAGLLAIQNGDIAIAGLSVKKLKRKDLAKKISFLPQKLSLVYSIPVRDFILAGRYPFLRPLAGYTDSDHQAVEQIIKRLCLESIIDRYLHELSGGEQQRVLLAGALVQEARFVVLDEPSAFLDPVQQYVLYESLKDVQRVEGIGIIVASHNLPLSKDYSSRIVALAEGTVVYDGSPRDFADPMHIKATYGKEVSF